MDALAIYFFNLSGTMMRVLNCFTRRGLILHGVWCAPTAGRHRATVLVEAAPITIEQIIRELKSTVGVDAVEILQKPKAAELSKGSAPEATVGENGETVIKVAGPLEENQYLLSWLGAASTS